MDPELEQQQLEQAQQTTTNDSGSNQIEELIRASLGEAERTRLALEQRLREQEDELRRLKQGNVQQVQEVPINDQEFWQKPAQNLNQMISRQTEPLVEFVNEMKQQKAYETLKAQYRIQYPAFAQIEPLVDKYMQGKEISHASIQGAVREAMGELALSGALTRTQQTNQNTQQTTQNNQQTTNNNPAPNQAHLRPTNNSPANQQTDDKPKRRPLTEHERRIIREQKITEDRFWELLEGDAKVETWKGGK